MSRRPRRKSAVELAQKQWALIDALATANVKDRQDREWAHRHTQEYNRLLAAAEDHFRGVLGEPSSSASSSASASAGA